MSIPLIELPLVKIELMSKTLLRCVTSNNKHTLIGEIGLGMYTFVVGLSQMTSTRLIWDIWN